MLRASASRSLPQTFGVRSGVASQILQEFPRCRFLSTRDESPKRQQTRRRIPRPSSFPSARTDQQSFRDRDRRSASQNRYGPSPPHKMTDRDRRLTSYGTGSRNQKQFAANGQGSSSMPNAPKDNPRKMLESMNAFFTSKPKNSKPRYTGSQNDKELTALRKKLFNQPAPRPSRRLQQQNAQNRGANNGDMHTKKGASGQQLNNIQPFLTEIIQSMQDDAKPRRPVPSRPTRHQGRGKWTFQANKPKDERSVQSIRDAIHSRNWRRPPHSRLQSQRRRRQPSANRGRRRSVEPPKEQMVFVDVKTQTVTIPSHAISLAEVSLLFREKETDIRFLLTDMGALSAEDATKEEENIPVEPDVVQLIADELGRNYEFAEAQEIQDDQQVLLQRRLAGEEGTEGEVAYDSFPPRPPVVCIMGHVDHGKTTLMDALRRRASGAEKQAKKSKKKDKKKGKKGEKGQGKGDVAGTEAGGITQVISAFQIPIADAEIGAVSFLDTPGHAAFKSMRQSGSDAADVIVLVVAADDGISAQTVEIIDCYKSIIEGSGSSGISLVVALNKIDKPGVDIDEARMRVETELLEHGILAEGMPSEQEGKYGPPVQLFPVSGLTGEGLDDLVEGLVLQSEIMDLRADDNAACEGVVLDAKVDKGLGVVADCIIRWGSIETGDIIVSGTNTGKVRILKDVNNKQVKKGAPSQPVRIVGFETVPKAGDPIVCVASEEDADELIARREVLIAAGEDEHTAQNSDAELQTAGKQMVNIHWREQFESKYGTQESEEDNADRIRIPVIVRADADGTLAAIRDSLVAIADESSLDVVIDPIRTGVGPVQAADVEMAKECGAAVFCFNLKNEQATLQYAEAEEVSVLGNDVIYRLLEAAKDEFVKHFPAGPVEVVHGRGQVQAVFDIGGSDSKVAGLRVQDGSLHLEKVKGSEGMLEVQYRVLRGKTVITPDTSLKATSLKHFKEDVSEIGRGKECGLSLSDFDDYEAGDMVECFTIEMKKEFV